MQGTSTTDAVEQSAHRSYEQSLGELGTAPARGAEEELREQLAQLPARYKNR